jgi:hypothetical protein
LGNRRPVVILDKGRSKAANKRWESVGFHCRHCGETDETKFSRAGNGYQHRLQCRECLNIKARVRQQKRKGPRLYEKLPRRFLSSIIHGPPRPKRCKCGEDEPAKFYREEWLMCKKCIDVRAYATRMGKSYQTYIMRRRKTRQEHLERSAIRSDMYLHFGSQRTSLCDKAIKFLVARRLRLAFNSGMHRRSVIRYIMRKCDVFPEQALWLSYHVSFNERYYRYG